jgi:hypothetical protein
MPRVRFVEDRDVLDGAGRVTASFRAGEVYELSDASARRWVRRSVAHLVGQEAPAPRTVDPPLVQSDAFARHRQSLGISEPAKASGEPNDAATGTASSSSPAAPASGEPTSSGSAAAPASSPSTAPGNSAPGPTPSTPATPSGGDPARRRGRGKARR